MTDLWCYDPERCDGDFCPGNCDGCWKAEEDDFYEAKRTEERTETHACDYISRQAAIRFIRDKVSLSLFMKRSVDKADKACMELCDMLDRELPSAQQEIIRCKDCKWYGRADKRRFYRGMDCLQKRIDTIIPDKDFCSRAERRIDGTAARSDIG